MGSSDDHCNSHVALLAFPFGTHAAPLYTLASVLASAAPTSTFSFFSTSSSNSKLTHIPVPPNLTRYDVSDGSLQGYDTPPIRNPQEEINLFLKATPGNFRSVMEVAVRDGAGGVEISCVVSDAFLWFAGKMSVEMHVPWIALWTGGTSSLSAHIYTDDIRRDIGVGDHVLSEQRERSLAVIPGMSDLRVRDLPEGIVFGKLDSLFSLLLHRMGLEIPNATAVALNTFQALDAELITQLNINKLNNLCFPVGPLNLITPSPTSAEPDESNCLSWLDTQSPNSVAYIGFGTVMSPPPEELSAIAEALESTAVPFLWSLNDKLKAQLPSRLLVGGVVVPWAPQVEVLNHAATGAFLTHCGWNSVTESICGGVPMICRPMLGDQRLNARAASEKWKIGLMVEESDGVLTKEWLSKALLTVLKSVEGRTMRERVVRMKEMAHKAVEQGGSSAQSLDALLLRILGKKEFSGGLSKPIGPTDEAH